MNHCPLPPSARPSSVFAVVDQYLPWYGFLRSDGTQSGRCGLRFREYAGPARGRTAFGLCTNVMVVWLLQTVSHRDRKPLT